MIRTTLLLTMFLSCLPISSLAERPIVRVGIYPFAPFVESVDDDYQGVTLELLTLLNKIQQQFHFSAVAISPKRRYQAFNAGDYDMLLYENRKWGWQDIEVQSSQVYQRGRELYVALADAGRDQTFFSELKHKRLIGILGYHYGFAGFNSNEHELRQHYNIILSWDHRRNFDLLLERHGDVLIVNQSYLDRYLHQHPERARLFLLSQIADQEYHHTALLRPGSPLSIDYLNTLLKQITTDGSLAELLKRMGMNPELVVPISD